MDVCCTRTHPCLCWRHSITRVHSHTFHLAPSRTLLRHRTRLRLRLRRLYTTSSMSADDADDASSPSPSQHVHEVLAAAQGGSLVFMTGFPGFLASALAERLLSNDPALQLHCLVQRAFVAVAQVSARALLPYASARAASAALDPCPRRP